MKSEVFEKFIRRLLRTCATDGEFVFDAWTAVDGKLYIQFIEEETEDMSVFIVTGNEVKSDETVSNN